jgi:MoaA/NifB/PqqE/SkfB family radical SAM enzyme
VREEAKPGGRSDPAPGSVGDPLSGFFQPYSVGAYRGLEVLLDTTNRCNLRCIMCHFTYRSAQDATRQEWTPAFLDRVEQEVFPHARHVQVSLGTEPLMWKHFPGLLDALQRARVPYVEMITNGQLLTEGLARKIVQSGMTRVQISLEGATRETYEAIRVGGRFDRLIRNIRMLDAARKSVCSRIPHLQFNVTLMRRNAHEVEDILRLGHDLGVQDLDFRHLILHDDLDLDHESFLHDRAGFNRLMARVQSLARTLGMKINMAPPDFQLETAHSPEDGPADPAQLPVSPAFSPRPDPDDPLARPMAPLSTTPGSVPPPVPEDAPLCWAPWRQIFLRFDHQVVPCPFWYTPETMGDLRHHSFLEIWEGSAYRRLRKELLTRDYGANCRNCPLRGKGRVDDENAHYAHNLEKARQFQNDASRST